MDAETKLRYDVARFLHIMYCNCGKSMSEYPFESSWLSSANALLDVIRQNYDITQHGSDSDGTFLKG